MNKFVVYSGNGPQLIRNALNKRGNWEEITEDNKDVYNLANVIWRPVNLSVVGYVKLDDALKRQPKEFVQALNHFENNRGICTKTGLTRSLKQYYNQCDQARAVRYNVWDTMATSYILVSGVEDVEYTQFIARFKDIARQNYAKEALAPKHCQENIWLVKPANMNQGRGIEVFRNLKDILHFIGTRPPNSYWVAQKYIEKPLLYHGRKFDLRIWVTLTNKMELFVYKKAYMRTSSFTYDMKNPNNYVHLTNNCLQKHGDNYGKHEEGNTLGLEYLKKYLEEMFPNYNIDFDKMIFQRMRDLIIDTFLSWKKNFNPNKRKNVFELFGYDFLIDEDLRTWLIEVNTNPYLGVPNDYIAEVLPKMLDDMFEITVDPLFPPKNPPNNGPNDYELLYCEAGSTYHDGPFSARSIYSKNVYPVSELIPEFDKSQKSQLGPKGVSSKEEIKEPEEINEPEAVHRIHQRSASVEDNGPSNNPNMSNMEVIHKNLYNVFYTRNTVDPLYVQSQISRILSGLVNWELLSDKQTKAACKALRLVAQSPVSFLLGEQKNLLLMSKLINSQNVKLEIQVTVIESLTLIGKEVAMKKKIMCNKIVHDLVTICLTSCMEKTLQDHHPNLRLSALNLLEVLAGIDSRKIYIPGETRELEKIRNFFIAQGGMAAVYLISQKSLDDNLKTIAQKEILNLFDMTDWEKVSLILDMVKQSNSLLGTVVTPKAEKSMMKLDSLKIGSGEMETEQNKENGERLSANMLESKMAENTNADNDTTKDTEIIFYKTSEDFFENKDKPSKTKANDKMVSFPAIVFTVCSYEELVDLMKSQAKTMKDSIVRRDQEEKEKKIQTELEKHKADERRKQEAEEKRKQAFDSFEARFQQNQKRQTEMKVKKQKEIEEIKHREMEERKKYEDKIKQKVSEAKKGQRLSEVRSKSPSDMRRNMAIFGKSSDVNDNINIIKSPKSDKKQKIILDGAKSSDASELVKVLEKKIKQNDERGRKKDKNDKLPSISQDKFSSTTRDPRYRSEDKVLFTSNLVRLNNSVSPNISDEDISNMKDSNKKFGKNKDKEDWKKNLSKHELDKAHPYLQNARSPSPLEAYRPKDKKDSQTKGRKD
jgi:hypothetical protein